MTTAYVNMWNERIGAVLWDPARRLASFEYEPGFLQRNWNIAPIYMPVETGRIYSFTELADSRTFKGLPGLLADVLPDRYGHRLINEWLARQGRTADSMHPVELLCFIGKRGVGALEFEPVNPDGADRSTKVEITSLVEVARNILNDRQDFSGQLNRHDEKSLLDILKIGTSAGGARAKALIAYNAQTGEVRSGQAEAPKGFEHWLIKFDGVHDSQFGASEGYGRVEMAYYEMAIAAGIEMMPSRLFEENGRAHFMTRRFDRPSGQGKLHVQTWCALTHRDFEDINSFGYEELFQTMRMLRLPYPDAEQLFRRMIFNVMSRNCDDHTKNFAFMMDKAGEWRLSPAYDICHAYRPGSYWVSRHCLSVNGKRENIDRNDFLAVARQMNIKKPAEIIDDVLVQVKRWPEFAEASHVSLPLSIEIGTTHLYL